MQLHVFYSVMQPMFARIVKDLQARYGVGPDPSGVLYGRDYLPELEALGVSTRNVRVLTDVFGDGTTPPDMGYLREKEQQYGDPHLQLLINNDRFAAAFERPRALRFLESCFRVVEDLWDRTAPDAVMSDPVACTLSHVQYLVARGRRIRFLNLTPSRLNHRLAIIGNRDDCQDKVNAAYAEFKKSGVPAELRREAEALIETFRAAKLRPPRFHEYTRVPALSFEKLRELYSLARRRRVDAKNHLLAPLHQAVTGRLVRIAKARILEPGYFEQPVPGEKFVLFPLHLQPESTTLILAPFCVNQIAVIEDVARAMPVDHVLYVKEHGVSRGRRPLGFYRAIKQIRNVRLITPDCDTHDLINRASASCVINSTVGWEGMLYQRPVVTLGNVSYNSYDLVHHVKARAELPAALHRAIHDHRPDPELLVAYIAANIAGTYDADVNFNPGWAENPTLEPLNIRKLTDAVASELSLTTPAAVHA
ncbi:MAG TPA: hypothetical protein VEA16_11325 [Vicinamibacterales bacterium]|nr:hypothetical protein [Vicinamibacterales bacterium]